MRDATESMWYCPTCRAWNGTQLPACLECDRDRPNIPVTSDNVPVNDSRDVTPKHRVHAKIRYLAP